MSAHTAEAIALVQGLLDLGIPLNQIPAEHAPEGQTSNLKNPSTRGYMITVCNVVCLVLVTGFVAIRMFTRLRIVKNFGYDDYCTLFALVCWIAETALFQYAVTWGAGTHLWDVTIAMLYPNLLRAYTTAAIIYSITMMFAKISILLLYRRLFPIANFAGRWWFVLIFTVCYSMAGATVSLFQCRPVRSAWTLMVLPEYCVNQGAFYTANASLNVVSDVMILALPIPIVWGLNTTLRKKIVLTMLFLMGSISCVVSVLRLRSIVALYKPGYTDVTWGLVEVVIWSQAELTAAMICTCTPCLRPFFERFTPSFFSMSSSKNNSTMSKYGKTGNVSKRWTGAAITGGRSRNDIDEMEMGEGITKEVQVGVHSVSRRSASQDSILLHKDNY